MNNFTKDDLILLHELTLKDIHWLRENSKFIDLNNKIKEIIDYYDAQIIKVWHCEKCGHVQ